MLSEKIKKLAEGTDKLDELAAIIDEANSIETDLELAKQTIAERESKISELRDTNSNLAARLFLSQTKPVDEEEKPEPTGDELLENLFKE